MISHMRRLVYSMASRSRMIKHALFDRNLSNQSFSQCGEDLILKFAFHSLGVFHPTYLDIGAHHPSKLSNTALFYKSGSRGVNVEPNPQLFREFQAKRTRDINLNIGVSSSNGRLDFYIMNIPELSTFSEVAAREYITKQFVSIERIVRVDVVAINELMKEHQPEGGFDLLSIDVEGLDKSIIESIDFSIYRPMAICVETVDFVSGCKTADEMSTIMNDNGYFTYADTFVNTIYFDKSRCELIRQTSNASVQSAS